LAQSHHPVSAAGFIHLQLDFSSRENSPVDVHEFGVIASSSFDMQFLDSGNLRHDLSQWIA